MSWLETVPTVQYADPWAAPFGDRFAALTRRGRRIAYFYEVADSTTFRYRAYNPCQVLNAHSADVSASYFFLLDFENFDRIAAAADVLILCRVRYSSRINALVTRFRTQRKPVIYDIDDLVYDINYAHLLIESVGADANTEPDLNFWYAYIGRVNAALRLCEGAIATNAFLAAKLEAFLGKRVKVMPNFLNAEQLRISNWIYEAKALSRLRDDDRIYLGYFSGSSTHQRDFSIVEKAIEAAMRSDERVCLRVVGFIDVGQFPSQLRHRVQHLPFMDFVNLQRIIGSVHLNLVPLQNNVFTNCKSELKYFESAIVGTPSIASPTFGFERCIVDGENGYLAKAHEWDHAIPRALDDIRKHEPIAVACRDHAELHYGPEHRLAEVLAAVDW